eukprot:TRINITY_DN11700_c0_g1_i1.p1 TRINITY_DN11700_c0_g1~~TRINITY_DN11700_c0_g1_i1.p1  ORF type:complete len:528 (-),score=170.40 TRINITY_DN11700_c0_g1_i1:11-1465(-)
MLSFFLSMLPSEMCLQLLILQVWAFVKTVKPMQEGLRKVIERIEAGEDNASVQAERPLENASDLEPDRDEASREIVLSVQSREFEMTTLNLGIRAVGGAIGLWGIICSSKMLFYQLLSKFIFRSALNKGSITRNNSVSLVRWLLPFLAPASAPPYAKRIVAVFARLLLLFLPLPLLLSHNILKIPSITYTTQPKTSRSQSRLQRLKLDIYYHQKRLRKNAPVFMYIHGGGWVTGHRKFQSIPLLYQIARAGWLVVTINYRLAPRVRLFPEQIQDCKRAIAWIRENAHKHGGDGSNIVVCGDSAGGNLATLLALTANDPVLQPEECPDVDTSVLGCVNLFGVMDLMDSHDQYRDMDASGGFHKFIQKMVMKRKLSKHPEKFKKASPYWVIQEADREQPCPIMTIHGSIDTLVPVKDSQLFMQALADKRASALSPDPPNDVYVQLPNAHHAFNYLISPRTLWLGDAVTDFIEHIYNKQNAPSRHRL